MALKTIGFPKSTMPQERRVAVLPAHVPAMAPTAAHLWVERSYGAAIGIRDREYREAGARVVPRRELSKADILCCPKRWVDDEALFREGQTLMGWLYVDSSPWLAESIVRKKLTAIAFEKMYDEEGKYVFIENRIITGRLGILQSVAYAQAPPELLTVALLGRGNVAQGAMMEMKKLGMRYTVFHRENVEEFYHHLPEWDMVVNCTRSPPGGPPVVSREHIASLKAGCLIADLSTEGVECSKPQSLLKPVYAFKQIFIYNNWHIPTLWARYASESIGQRLMPFLQDLMEGRENRILQRATVALEGRIL